MCRGLGVAEAPLRKMAPEQPHVCHDTSPAAALFVLPVLDPLLNSKQRCNLYTANLSLNLFLYLIC